MPLPNSPPANSGPTGRTTSRESPDCKKRNVSLVWAISRRNVVNGKYLPNLRTGICGSRTCTVWKSFCARRSPAPGMASHRVTYRWWVHYSFVRKASFRHPRFSRSRTRRPPVRRHRHPHRCRTRRSRHPDPPPVRLRNLVNFLRVRLGTKHALGEFGKRFPVLAGDVP